MQLNSQLFAEILSTVSLNAAQLAGSEKRRATRIAVESRINISAVSNGAPTAPATALTRDLSQVGVGILTGRKLAAGEKMLLELPRGGGKPSIAMMCHIRHARSPADGVYILGAEFAEVLGNSDASAAAQPTSDEEERIRKRILGS